MKFKPGDKVRYVDSGHSDGPQTGEIYTVSKRSRSDNGIHLEEFPSKYDWWYDYRFELFESGSVYLVLTECTREYPTFERFTKADKFTKEELKTWLEKEHRLVSNPSYQIFRCVPVKATVLSTVEIEE